MERRWALALGCLCLLALLALVVLCVWLWARVDTMESPWSVPDRR